MEERPNVKLSVDLGRRFMLSEQIWFDTDMCRSSVGLTTPVSDTPSIEKIKYVICCHAMKYYKDHELTSTLDQLQENLWFRYGFILCCFDFNSIYYRALVSIRGICWVDPTPASVVDPDGFNYPGLLTKVKGPRNNLRELLHNQ